MGSGIVIRCSDCYEDDRKGTYFELYLGGGMFCFCKEQFEKYYGVYKKYDREYRLLAAGDPPDELYSKLDSPVKDKKINAEIYENIKKGYSFTENLGYKPYYCETCKKLLSLFYFQMELNGSFYIPKYHCYECKNELGLLKITWEDNENDGDEDEEDVVENIEIKYNLIIKKDNVVKIEKDNEEKKLICKCCNNDKFIYSEEDGFVWD
jgi:hypothetical protein